MSPWRAAYLERQTFHAHRKQIANDVEVVGRGAAAAEAGAYTRPLLSST